MATKRKDPCPCGSGKKYKRCCGQDADTAAILPAGDVALPAQSSSAAPWPASVGGKAGSHSQSQRSTRAPARAAFRRRAV